MSRTSINRTLHSFSNIALNPSELWLLTVLNTNVSKSRNALSSKSRVSQPLVWFLNHLRQTERIIWHIFSPFFTPDKCSKNCIHGCFTRISQSPSPDELDQGDRKSPACLDCIIIIIIIISRLYEGERSVDVYTPSYNAPILYELCVIFALFTCN